MDFLEQVHHKAIKMKGLAHYFYEERLRELRVFSLEKVKGALIKISISCL